MAKDVKSGGISRFLVMPISYFGYRLSVFLGGNAINMLLAVAVLFALQPLGINISETSVGPLRMAAFLFSLSAALVLNFLFFFLIGLTSFWTVEAWGIFETSRVGLLILSGGIFPLEVFGTFWQKAFAWLPFEYVVYFPIQIIDGRLPATAVMRGLGIQMIWLLLFAFLGLAFWGRSARRLVTVGG